MRYLAVPIITMADGTRWPDLPHTLGVDGLPDYSWPGLLCRSIDTRLDTKPDAAAHARGRGGGVPAAMPDYMIVSIDGLDAVIDTWAATRSDVEVEENAQTPQQAANKLFGKMVSNYAGGGGGGGGNGNIRRVVVR